MADDLDLPEWETAPELWNGCGLGGYQLPGIVTVEDASTGRRLDTKKAPGADGAGIADKGLELAKFKITVTIWTQEHLTAWRDMQPTILPRERVSERKALEIVHPALVDLGITSVYVQKITALVPGSIPGARTATIHVVEYIPKPTRRRGRAGAVNSSQTDANESNSTWNGPGRQLGDAASQSPSATGAAEP
jgi:hypothetical protein